MIAIKRRLNNKPIGVNCKALKDLEKRLTNKDVAAKYGVLKNTFSTWVKYKHKLTTSLEKKGMSSSRKSIRCGSYDQIHKAVFHWFFGKRSQKVPIDGIILNEKDLEFGKTLRIKEFKASNCWLNWWEKNLPSFILNWIFSQRISTIFLGLRSSTCKELAFHPRCQDWLLCQLWQLCILHLVCSEEIWYHLGKFPVFTKR